MCILFIFTLLKAINYYDSSVLYMSVMGLKKKSGRVGGVSSIQIVFGIF